MANKIALISDDLNFYDYMKDKINMRKSDELFVFKFDDVPSKIQYLKSAIFIINSEGVQEKTLQLLALLKGIPSAVFGYNEDVDFKQKCYEAGVLDYMTLLVSDEEFQARLVPLLSVASIIEKSLQYRRLLVSNNIMAKNNEVYVNYELILESELEKVIENSESAVFFAISPNENDKFLIQPNTIETVILNNIRKNDILMNFAPNKYFVLMHDITMEKAQNLWDKIQNDLHSKLYAGMVNVTTSKKHLLINEALNKMHEAINFDVIGANKRIDKGGVEQEIVATESPYKNFKLYKQNFERKLEQIISPAFYRIRQKYSERLMSTQIHQDLEAGTFYIKGDHKNCSFKISTPGFSKINIDITSQKDSGEVESKRITLEPDELETGVLEDLLEQMVLEYKEKV